MVMVVIHVWTSLVVWHLTIAASWGLRLAHRLATTVVLLLRLVLEVIVKVLLGHSFNSFMDIRGIAVVGSARIAVVGVSGRVTVVGGSVVVVTGVRIA